MLNNLVHIPAAGEAAGDRMTEERKNEKVTHDQQGKGKMDVNCC